MAKLFKWRFTDRVPLSYQTVIPVLGLVIVLLSFLMLPKSGTWSDNLSAVLVDRVSSFVVGQTNSTPNHQTGTAGDDDSLLRHSADNLSSTLPPAVAPSALLEARSDSSSASDSNLSDVPTISSPAASVNSSVTIPENRNTTSDTSPVVTLATAHHPESAEKFLVPLLSYQVGAGNQFMEYLSAAVMARSLNRTLCLSAFFPGPSRHTGRVTSGLAWEDRYQVSSLSRFTRVASLQRCLQECHHTLDDKWMLKSSREPRMDSQWKKYPLNNEALNLKWDYVKWTAPEDIAATLGGRDGRCVGMLGLFPGLRWRGAFLAISAFIQPAAHINRLADALQEYALGVGTPYLAVHWRFEESECRGHHVGLCFVRCDDGSVIDSGLRPKAQEWRGEDARCTKRGQLRGVVLDKQDILDTIHERALNHSVHTIYLATDGWMRGAASIEILKDVVQSLRKRGLTVVGLWKVPGLPNFRDGKYFDPATTLGDRNSLNGAQIGLVEQELCSRSASFMGSGPSTFSLAVFRVRLARRRAKQIEASSVVRGTSNDATDALIAETLLRDAHAAGLHCRYLRYMKRAAVKETMETYADEYPDGWLDLEACEGRLDRGGHCQVAQCF